MSNKIKVTNSQQKVVQFKQQGNVAFSLFLKSQNFGLKIDLEEILSYPLTSIPYSISTPNGALAKTDKSKSMHHLLKDVESVASPQRKDALTIHDGNAFFYYLNGVPPTFGQISSKLFDIMPVDCDSVFSTDINYQYSVKSEWASDKYAPRLESRKVIFICNGNATLLSSGNGKTTTISDVPGLNSAQEETHTWIIIYCQYALDKGYKYVKIHTPDSDIFWILLHYAHSLPALTILLETGKGTNKGSWIWHSCPNYIPRIFALHFCHCTHSVDVIVLVHSKDWEGEATQNTTEVATIYPSPKPSRQRLGISDDVLQQLEAFTCAIYGNAYSSSVDCVRYARINELVTKTNSPPKELWYVISPTL